MGVTLKPDCYTRALAIAKAIPHADQTLKRALIRACLAALKEMMHG